MTDLDNPIKIESREILTWNGNRDVLYANIFANVHNRTFGNLFCTVEVQYDFTEEQWFYKVTSARKASAQGVRPEELFHYVSLPWKKSTAYTVFEELQEELNEELEEIIY